MSSIERKLSVAEAYHEFTLETNKEKSKLFQCGVCLENNTRRYMLCCEGTTKNSSYICSGCWMNWFGDQQKIQCPFPYCREKLLQKSLSDVGGGPSLREQSLRSSGPSLREQSLRSSGPSLREQSLRSSGPSLREQSLRSSGPSLREQSLRSSGSRSVDAYECPCCGKLHREETTHHRVNDDNGRPIDISIHGNIPPNFNISEAINKIKTIATQPLGTVMDGVMRF